MAPREGVRGEEGEGGSGPTEACGDDPLLLSDPPFAATTTCTSACSVSTSTCTSACSVSMHCTCTSACSVSTSTCTSACSVSTSTCTSACSVSTSTRVERFAQLHTFTRYCRDITRELRPVFTREIAFQCQNSLKFARKLARNSFSRFEGVNHGHTPDLA